PARQSRHSDEDQSFEPLLKGFDSRLGKHQRATTKNVVNVDTLHRQNVDIRDVGSGKTEVLVKLRATDQQRIGQAELGEISHQSLGLGFAECEIINHDQTC